MRPIDFDKLCVTYLEPFEEKSIGNWAKQLMQHIPSINKVPVDGPRRSLKRSYIESGVKYVEWFRKAFYEREIDLLLMSESLNYLALYTMYREYFKALPSIMFIHCTELDFNPLIRSQSSLWGELGAMTVVDRVHFFSDFSKRITLQRAKEYLSDKQIDVIDKKSQVMPLPIELSALDSTDQVREHAIQPLHLLYNHRLDPDKGYLIFLKALDAIHEKGIEFRLYLCGQPSSSSRDPLVQKYLQRWGSKVLHYGLVTDRQRYKDILYDSDIVINTCEEVMGISMIEAVYCGCWPVIFDDGALPDIFGTDCHKYKTTEDLVQLLQMVLTAQSWKRNKARHRVVGFDWKLQASAYKDSWYQVYDRKMKTDKLTGALQSVVAELQKGPLTKKQILFDTLGWGSFDYWPVYRYRLLTNSVDYDRTLNQYSLSQQQTSIISLKDQPEVIVMKDVICKVCKINTIHVSDQAVSGVCKDCVMKGALALEQQEKKDQRVDDALRPKRYKYHSVSGHGERTKLIDPLILQNKTVNAIVVEVLAKLPTEDEKRIRNLVYVRRGALRSRGAVFIAVKSTRSQTQEPTLPNTPQPVEGAPTNG